MKTLTQLLTDLNACEDAVKFSKGKTIEQALKECPRGDWMLWIADKVQVNDRKLTLAKAHCANTVRHLMKDERSIKAVETAIAYGEGLVSKEELNAAAYAAYAAAGAAAYAAGAAAYAAYDAAGAAAPAAAAYAADAAAAAAYAAADAAAAAPAAPAAYAAAANKKENKLQAADICRKYIGQEIINAVNQRL